MHIRHLAATLMLLAAAAVGPAAAQVTVLDQAQDQAGAAAEPPPPCGTRPLSIARMAWPSAELLAEIHARILASSYGCTVEVVPGDLAATASAMGSTGQPAVAPEMWPTRAVEVWNAGVEAQMLRQTAPTYGDAALEGWYVPDYLAEALSQPISAAGLAEALPDIGASAPVRFVSCPPDWACSVINRNLVEAYGLTDLVELVEPANRFEMDTLLAEAVSRSEPIIFYYWAPNAVLSQFDFLPLDMGAYDEEAAQCLARTECASPEPSAFAAEPVVIAVSEWVFTEAPQVAGYLQRASLPLEEMNAMLAQLSESGATAAGVADRFVADRAEIWEPWVGAAAP